MIVYRLTHAKYADQLSSSGAANRWNQAFQFVIYCSENISLCALELLAHTNGIRSNNFQIRNYTQYNSRRQYRKLSLRPLFQAVQQKNHPENQGEPGRYPWAVVSPGPQKLKVPVPSGHRTWQHRPGNDSCAPGIWYKCLRRVSIHCQLKWPSDLR